MDEMRLHGTPRLVVGGRELPLERKSAGLLAYLAIHGDATRGALATLFWPDSPPEGARNNLRQVLFKLRKAARTDLVVGAEELSLAPGPSCDLGDASEGQVLLEGCEYGDCPEFGGWLERERERLAAQSAGSAAARAGSHEERGELAEALEAASRALRAAPLVESHHRRVMRLHYLRADRAAALAAFERCVRVLRAELDAEPDAETRALAASIGEESAPRPSSAASVMPVTLMRPPRLIGRDAELGSLDESWRSGRAFLVLGEAGLGKSRLLFEFGTRHPAAICVSSRPGDASIPYASLARLLRGLVESRPELADGEGRAELARLLPELGGAAAAAGEVRPRLIQEAIGSLLRRAAVAGCEGLVLDDLHFADPASIEMLNALAAGDLGTRWGFAQRPAEGAAAARELRETLGESWRLDTAVLKPLDERQMAELVDSLRVPGLSGERLAAQLVKATGGNPLFALETLKGVVVSGAALDQAAHGALPRPASVGALIGRRLSQLSPAALALARVAAIAGVDFDAEVAAEVLGIAPLSLADSWRELEDAQVLSDASFAHDLIYEATLAGVPAPIARHTHGVVAAMLERRSGMPEHIAEHWIGAGAIARAVPFLKASAVKAEAAARYLEARGWLDRAIGLTEGRGGPGETLELRFLLIELLKEIGSRGEIVGVVEKAKTEATTADERLRLARAELQAVADSTGDLGASRDIGLRYLEDEELVAAGSPLRVAELRHALASNYLAASDAVPALALLEPMAALFREHPDPQFRGWFHSDLGRAMYSTDRIAEAEAELKTALALARQVGRRRMISGVMSFAANTAAAAGRIGEPAEHIREAQLLIAERDDSNLGRIFHIFLGDFLARQGRYREALASLETARVSTAPLAPIWFARLHEVRALALAQLGSAHEARAELAAGNAIGAASLPAQRRLRLVYRMEALCLIGQPVAELSEYEALLDETAPASARWRGRLIAAATGAVSDDFETVAASARAAGLMGHAAAAHVAAARAAALSGKGEVAVANVRAALELLRRFTLSGAYRPALWLACHEAAREADPGLASQALREGADWVRTVARFHVPEERRDAFLDANRVNRTLITLQ